MLTPSAFLRTATLGFVALVVIAGAPLTAQVPAETSGTELLRLARERYNTIDRRLVGYETVVRERNSVNARLLVLDRLVFRRESATRIDWQRDGPLRLNVLGAREVAPAFTTEVSAPSEFGGFLSGIAFDPMYPDALVPFDSAVIRHPLAPASEQHYRFEAGDTMTLGFPDGRQVRLVELRVVARRSEPQLLNGSFWLHADTHAVVRAFFQLARGYDRERDFIPALADLAHFIGLTTEDGKPDDPDEADDRLPGILGPVTADLDFIAIEYGLWDLEWWLPRRVAWQGYVQAGRITVRNTYERTYDEYRLRVDSGAVPVKRPEALPYSCRSLIRYDSGLEVDSIRQARADSARVRRNRMVDSGYVGFEADCPRELIVSAEPDSVLIASPVLPERAYLGDNELISEADLRQIEEMINEITGVPTPFIAMWQWGLGSRLIRFNRVEGLSVGTRAGFAVRGATVAAQARIGLADQALRGELTATQRAGNTMLQLGAFRRLDSAIPSGRAHTLGASVRALLFGVDDEEFYDARGGELLLKPHVSRPQWYDFRLYAERQRAVTRNTSFSLAHLIDADRDFRENFAADAADQLGARLRLRGGLGKDPARPRLTGELSLGGETGTYRFLRPEATLRLATPLTGFLSLSVEGAAGTLEGGELPAQALWRLGGASTLRGYPPSSLVGERYWRGRAELGWGLPASQLIVFADWAWAGPHDRFDTVGTAPSLGGGISFFDGLFGLDVAKGLQAPGGWRVHLRLGGPW